jgi:hypothetical protein
MKKGSLFYRFFAAKGFFDKSAAKEAVCFLQVADFHFSIVNALDKNEGI